VLVITRREGEEVVIGDPRNPIGIVRVAQIRGDRVRLAFDFPRHVQVHRKEVADQIKDEPAPDVLAKLRPPASAAGTSGGANADGSDQASDGAVG
jgi:carbon storage regulator CsrA